MSTGDNTILENRTLSPLMVPVAALYESLANLRLNMYNCGYLKSTRVPGLPVLSVGNLTVGGTGKTPIVVDICRRLIAQGMNPVVLSRGYKKQSQGSRILVSDRAGILCTASEAGDEPYLMAKAVKGLTVISGKDRVANADFAHKQLGCDIAVLDDGFQHLRLHRELDMVLHDFNDNPSSMKLIPAGRLREPLSSLRRAEHIIISKVPLGAEDSELDNLESSLRVYNEKASFSACRFHLSRLYSSASDSTSSIGDLSGKDVMAFCGIARPQSFYLSLKENGANLVEQVSFADHHWFSPADLEDIKAKYLSSKAQYLVCTEKDLVRIPPEWAADIDLSAAVQEIQWLRGQVSLESKLLCYRDTK